MRGVVGQTVWFARSIDLRNLRELRIDALDEDGAAVGVGESGEIARQRNRVGQFGADRAVRHQSPRCSVVDPHPVPLHVGHRGVIIQRRDAAWLHRAAGKRPHHRGIAHEDHATAELIGDDDRAPSGLDCVVRLTAHTCSSGDHAAVGEAQLAQLVGTLERHQYRAARSGQAQVPRRSDRRNRLTHRTGGGVDQLDAVGISHGNRSGPRRSHNDAFGCVGDWHYGARRRHGRRSGGRGLSRGCGGAGRNRGRGRCGRASVPAAVGECQADRK